MKYENIVSKNKNIALKFGKETLNVTVDQTKFNYNNSVIKSSDETLLIDYVIDFFINKETLVSWDLEFNGEVVPLTKEALCSLNPEFLIEIFYAVSKDTRVTRKE